MMGRMCLVIATCAGSTLGLDLPSSFHPHESLTNLLSSSSDTHYYKSSGIIGVSSAFYLSYQQPTHNYVILCRPHVRFHCDVNFDPFTYLRENNKTYGPFLSCIIYLTFTLTSLNSGFTLSMYDYRPTLPSLWPAVKGLSDVPFSHRSDSRVYCPPLPSKIS